MCLVIVMVLIFFMGESFTPSSILVAHAFSPAQSYSADYHVEHSVSHLSMTTKENRRPRVSLKRLAVADIASAPVQKRTSELSSVPKEKSVKEQIQEKKDALRNAAAEAFKQKEKLRSQWMEHKNEIRSQKAFLKYKAQQKLIELRRKEEERQKQKDNQTHVEEAPEAKLYDAEPEWIELNNKRRNSKRNKLNR